MSFDDVLHMRCTSCDVIWLRLAGPREVDVGRQCLRCDGDLIVDD